jgi:hypothetical protein
MPPGSLSAGYDAMIWPTLSAGRVEFVDSLIGVVPSTDGI